ncbi:glycosyltransferase family 4 protein [Providencia burhodogranariea]|uniref:Group 1 glycosyl transferase n=1 Tax=Providencia burhodogranariea DSM 19968 TaxID=1141662 RepID=K8WD13_9GAMM|nr:glycosyltransferase family 4 protein [Providencia burhodogranariea]EKT54130.1 group 1 glycosyl transferase [Providencia burhodogranariea DSM 19968]
MKIAIIGTNASSILGFRKDLIISLIEKGHEVFAFAIDYTSDEKNRVENLGATPIDYQLKRTGLNPIHDIKTLIQLRKTLINISPDVVFSYFAKPVVFGTLAAVLARIPKRIAMLEGLGFTFTEQPRHVSIKTKFIKQIQVYLYRLAFPFLDRIIFLNNDDPVDLIEKYNLKVKEVNILGAIGLNLNDYPYSEPPIQPIRFIFIGRLLAEKGIHEYVAAARLVKKKYPNVEFIILGGLDEGNPGGLSQNQLNDLISDELITYPGHVGCVTDWLAKSSVFVLPSYREGSPRSTQEAMAIGRAVITTDAPGCRETVENGINGFIIPKYDIKALANKMEYFITNQEQIINMGNKSYKIAIDKYNANDINSRLINMLIN